MGRNRRVMCAVADCKNRLSLKKSRPELILHRFPIKDKNLCKIWAKLTKRKEDFNYKNAYICSDHFSKDAYQRDLKNELLGLPLKKVLKGGAVPTVFLGRESKIIKDGVKEREEREEIRMRKKLVDEILTNYEKEANSSKEITENSDKMVEGRSASNQSLSVKWRTALEKYEGGTSESKLARGKRRGTKRSIPSPDIPNIQEENEERFCCACWRVISKAPDSESVILSLEYYRCFLKEILEMDELQTESLLGELLQSQNVGMCPSCSDVLENASQLRKEISALLVQFNVHRRGILIGLKETLSTELTGKKALKDCVTLEKIANFVKEKKYGVLINDENESETRAFSSKAATAVGATHLANMTVAKNKYRITIKTTRKSLEMDSDISQGQVDQQDYENESQSTGDCNEDDTEVEENETLVSNRCSEVRDVEISKSSTYDCPACPKVKDYSVNKYARHLLLHQRRPYRCKMCFEFLPNDQDLREEHWKAKHSGKDESIEDVKFVKIKFEAGRIWKCEGCGERHYSKEERDEHENCCKFFSKAKQSEKLIYEECALCEETVRKGADWRFHRVLCHPEVDPYCCYYCDMSFKETTAEGVEIVNATAMRRHIFATHKRNSAAIYGDCEICGMIFNKVTAIAEHLIKIHGIPRNKCFPCKACDYSASKYQQCQSHMRNCHLKTICICDLCGESFRREITLTDHKFQEHSVIPEGVNVRQCTEEGCKFEAVTRMRMTTHIYCAHTLEKNRPYKCTSCRKAYKYSKDLIMHNITVHGNGEGKPFQCELCGLAFAGKNHLYFHKRTVHEKRKRPTSTIEGNRKKVSRLGISFKEKVEHLPN